MDPTIKRYTELPYLIDYLMTKELVLLDPSSWDDRNDSFYIDQYSKSKGLKSTKALCLTESSETYHHWKVFSSGSSGVCIEFLKEDLINYTSKIDNLRAESVNYCTINEIRKDPLRESELPFIKRHAYRDEQEFRLFWESTTQSILVFRFSLPVSAINRIILSPWLPKEVSNHVKQTLKNIPGCKNIKIYRSTLVENERWKRLAKNHS